MAPKPKLTEADVTMVESMLFQGYSFRDVGTACGCDHVTVSKFVKRYLPSWHRWFVGQRTPPPWRAHETVQ